MSSISGCGHTNPCLPNMETSNDIDVSKLQRELVSALESDRRYARENDAKFRAVSQKVASYEEFR